MSHRGGPGGAACSSAICTTMCPAASDRASLELGRLEGRFDGDLEGRKRLQQARREVATSPKSLRAVARGLHPAVVSGHGLAGVPESLAVRAVVLVRLTVDVGDRLPEGLEVAACSISSSRASRTSASTPTRPRPPWTSGTPAARSWSRSSTTAWAARTPSAAADSALPAARVEALDGRLQGLEPCPAAVRDRAEILRAVIAEDSVLLREGLERLLSENGLDVVGTCTTAEELLLKVRSYDPDVAIVDIRLPPTHNDEGLRAALQIRSRSSVGRRARPLAVRGGRPRRPWPTPGSKVPATSSLRLDQRGEGLHRGRSPCRRRRVGHRPDHRLDAPLETAGRRSARRARLRAMASFELMAEGRSNQGTRMPRHLTASGREVRFLDLRQVGLSRERQRPAARARPALPPAFLRRGVPASEKGGT